MNAIENLENDVKEGFKKLKQQALDDKEELLKKVKDLIEAQNKA